MIMSFGFSSRHWSAIHGQAGFGCNTAFPTIGPVSNMKLTTKSISLHHGRGSTCSEFIYSLRLDHAARLLHRRASLATSQPLSEIAYACGFRDYTHFARRFRHRFGYPPGGRAGRATVRAGTGTREARAHDVLPPAV